VRAPQINGLTFATIAGGAFVALALTIPAGAQAAVGHRVGAGHRQRVGEQRLQGCAEQVGHRTARPLHGRLGPARRDGHPFRPKRGDAGEPNRLPNRVFDGEMLTNCQAASCSPPRWRLRFRRLRCGIRLRRRGFGASLSLRGFLRSGRFSGLEERNPAEDLVAMQNPPFGLLGSDTSTNPAIGVASGSAGS
jgi:hypothetical protein